MATDQSAPSDRPLLSVVVATTSAGGDFLAGCLDALERQCNAPRMEVLVPVDTSIEGWQLLRERHPGTRFLTVEGTAALAASADVGVAHLAIDRRRSAALAAARGEVVALTEERARPEAHWCRRLVEVHQGAEVAIGGAIENANPRLINWALYFFDAGRYQNPLPEGPARYLSDLNVSYKRGALVEISEVWRESYHETGLHDALRAKGGGLELRRDLVVSLDRGQVTLGTALRERFAWARLFAGRRSREVPTWKRWLLAAGAPLLTVVFPLRQARRVLARGSHLGAFLGALPLLLLMALIWSAGELLGYATGLPTKTNP